MTDPTRTIQPPFWTPPRRLPRPCWPATARHWLRQRRALHVLRSVAGRLVLWPRRHPTGGVAAAVIGVIAVLLGPVLWTAGGWDLIGETTGRAIKDPDKTVEAYGKLIGAVGLLAAAPVGLLGVGLAFWRTWNQHRDGVLAVRKLEAETYAKAAEAFAKAVDHLGSDKSPIRMGAVLALEALGKATPRLLSQAIEILCAYVRENRAVASSSSISGENGAAAAERARLPTDVQLIVAIVGRLKRLDADHRIPVDLSGTDLASANLIGADLRGADLSGADLRGAFLNGAELSCAYLREANLSGATLNGATLSEAILGEANLSGAELSHANLSFAELLGADLSGAFLSGATLSRAELSRANLSEANLSGADLSGASLHRAYLIGADLTEANLSGADLSESYLGGVDLSNADLSRANLEAACGNEHTKLPPGITLVAQSE